MAQDVTITVEDTQNINVSVTETPLNIYVAEMGTQGPPGPSGADAVGGGAANLSGYITTGNADQRYYFNYNPSGYLTGFNSGLYLLKSETGNYNNYFLLRNETGQFYPASNPQQYIKSGEVIGVYYLITNPSGYITNSGFALTSFVTGASGALQFQINAILNDTGNFISNSQTGQFYPASNPQQYIRSGDVQNTYATISNLFSTGNNLQNQINTITANTGNFISNSQTGQFYPASNPSQFISSGDVSTLIVNRITGSGTSNYIPKFTNDGSGLINSNIIDNGRIGVFNNNPQTHLDVSGSIRSVGGTISGNTIGDVTVGQSVGRSLQFNSRGVITPSGDGQWDFIGNNNGTFKLLGFGGLGSKNNYIFNSPTGMGISIAESPGAFYVNSGSNGLMVGINANPPIATLDVSGNITASGITTSRFSSLNGSNAETTIGNVTLRDESLSSQFSINRQYYFATAGLSLTNRPITFNTAFGGASDIGIARNNTGILEVNNGSANQYRDLIARNLISTGNVNISGAIVAGGTITVPSATLGPFGVLNANGARLGASRIDISAANGATMTMGGDYNLNWTNGSYYYNTADVGITRAATGTLKITDTTTSGYGNLIAKDISATGNIYVSGNVIANGVTLGAGGSTIANAVTGFGTTGYIPRFTANGSGIENSSIISTGNIITTTEKMYVSGIHTSFGLSNLANSAISIGDWWAYASSSQLLESPHTIRSANLQLNGGTFSLSTATNGQKMVANDSALAIEQRNGAIAQSYRIFNVTGLNTGEFAQVAWNNNKLILGTQAFGSGILRDLYITGGNIYINSTGLISTNSIIDSGNAISFRLLGTGQWFLDNNGLFPYVSATKSIGGASNRLNALFSNIVNFAGGETIQAVGAGPGLRVSMNANNSLWPGGLTSDLGTQNFNWKNLYFMTGFISGRLGIGMNNYSIPVSSLDVSGNITASGINTSSRAWSNLTWDTTTTWTANPYAIEDRKILVMTGNTTLVINGLYNGWAGLLQTIQSGNSASGYFLTMQNVTKVNNAGSGIINLTSGSGVYDMIGYQYDGNNLFANVGNQFN